MMVETILESTQDFAGMSGGALPQWKRELLQRRAARSRPPAPPPAPPPPPPPLPADDDEELRYGPGIVKRLKSRYLSLALRDQPRRRPSVLRRAASLEHLLDERPPPAPRPAARAPRPASLAAPVAPHHPVPRRDYVKRARSVDALSRLESRDEPPQSPPPPPPPPPPAPRPAARPPRRPTPLLRETERPPPDLVRSTLRKFEPAPVRRAAPAARVSAALRGLERGSTPPPPSPPASADPRTPSPVPAARVEPERRSVDEPEGAAASSPRAVSRAALEGIARAGSSTRYAFEAPRRGSHLPPLAATNPVLLGRARRVGVIRPMPAPPLERALSVPTAPAEEIGLTILVADKLTEEATSPRVFEPAPCPPEEAPPTIEPRPESPRVPARETPPSAMVEPIPRSPPDEPPPPPPERDASPDPPSQKSDAKPEVISSEVPVKPKPLVNGHSPVGKLKETVSVVRAKDAVPAGKVKEPTRVNGAEAWGGAALRRADGTAPRGAAAAAAARRPAPATSVVFNFSHRKEVPDYVENDGLILRASRRDRIKAGEPGVVVLRPDALALAGGAGGSSDEEEGEGGAGGGGPPSPCDVRFVNDNVLINGRSSMPPRAHRDKDRVARLKLQFDDSLTRTFEYPSETSLCLDSDDECAAPSTLAAPHTAPLAAPHTAAAHLAANTHIASAALARYTPHKTTADAFQLGVTKHAPPAPTAVIAEAGAENGVTRNGDDMNGDQGEGEVEGGAARACGADAAHCWSEARQRSTDLLF